LSAKPFQDARSNAGVLLLALLLQGCALVIPQVSELREAWPEGLPQASEIAQVPFFPQEDYQCGPAALAMTLAHTGARVTPDELIPEVYLPERRGSLQIEMLAAARRHERVSYPLAPRLEDLLREIAAGNPAIVLLDYGVWPVRIWHYAVAIGYDREAGRVIVHSGKRPRLAMPIVVLEYLWKESDYWAMVAVRPDRIPATATEEGYLAAVTAAARIQTPAFAKTAYSTLLSRWPDNLAAGIGLANAEHGLGDLAGAEAALRAVLARHPDSAAALNNLAQTLSDEGRNEEALGIVSRAQQRPGAFAAAIRETRETIERRLEEQRGILAK
jgi:tetratricopeptide (TPR) repeat protein